MERRNPGSRKASRALGTLAIGAAFALGLGGEGAALAGTQYIPPPPRVLDQDEHFQESSFEPYLPENRTADRFAALSDDEGREVSIRRRAEDAGDSEYRPARRANRSPAGLEVGGQPSAESARPTVSEPRRMASSATAGGAGAPKTPELQNDLADPLARRKGVQEIAVIASDLGFFPKTVFVSRDVPVRLFVTGASKQNLCIMMDSFNVRKQVRASKIEEITFVPSQPGSYRFYCPVNGSEGQLVVKELTTNEAGS